MNIKVAQIVGLNTDQKAALILYQQREEETFLSVLQLRCDDAFTKGRTNLSEFADFYFDFEGTAAEKLNATFKETLEKFSSADTFDLLLSAVSSKALYLIGQGEIAAYLKRRGKLSPLLEIGASAQIISGFLQVGDRILLSTKSLVAFLGEDLDNSLSLPIDRFEEEVSSKVTPLLDDSELDKREAGIEGQGIAGLAIEVLSEGEEQVIPIPEEEELQKPQFIKNIFASSLAIFQKITLYFPKSGRGRLILASILVAVLVVGLGFQYKSSRDKERKVQFEQNLQAAKDEFAAARGLSALNPAEAKIKLDGAKDKINLALSANPNSQEAKDLQKQIEEQSSSILKQFEALEFPLFLDLDLIKKDFKAQNLSLSAGKILLLDPETKTLVSLDLTKKSHEILSGKEKLGDAKYSSINGSLAFVYSEDKGVIRVDITNQKDSQVAKLDTDLEVKDIAGFASNVYLLDTGNPPAGGQIWKYLPTSTGYSDSREYLTKETKADFTNSLRMQIESSVYILKGSGEILRFTRGEKDHFSYGGLDKGVKDPKSIFTSSDTESLYVLDSGNSRLLVLTKTGEYKGQVSGDKFGSASDLVVDEKGKRVYLLEGSKIYSVDLK